MSLTVEIPDDVAGAIDIPAEDRAAWLRVELAVLLYAQERLGFGKARQLAQMSHLAFGRLLGDRGIDRHYDQAALDEDLAAVEEMTRARSSAAARSEGQ